MERSDRHTAEESLSGEKIDIRLGVKTASNLGLLLNVLPHGNASPLNRTLGPVNQTIAIKIKNTEHTRSHFPLSFSLSPIGTSPPSDSTPPCPSDILRCHAKQKTATTSRISRPDTPKQNTPHHIVSQKPSALVHNSALVHKRRVIRESTSKHNTTPSPTSIATLHLSKLTFNILIVKI